jgi:hypothetical protein
VCSVLSTYTSRILQHAGPDVERELTEASGPTAGQAVRENFSAAWQPTAGDRVFVGPDRARCRKELLLVCGFYVWASVASLPAPLNEGDAFFEAALKEHVITVPGSFFDINPGKRRADHRSRFRQYLRFSFGPDEASVTTAVERIKAMVARAGTE